MFDTSNGLTSNLIDSIKTMVKLLAEADLDDNNLKAKLLELAELPELWKVLTAVLPEAAPESGIHIHVHESNVHNHHHYPQSQPVKTIWTYGNTVTASNPNNQMWFSEPTISWEAVETRSKAIASASAIAKEIIDSKIR